MYQYTLETERLLLRPFTLNDDAAFFEFNQDVEVVQYTGNPPCKSVEGSRNIIQTIILPQYERYEMGRLAVIRKETGQIIGFCGLKYREENQEVDLGYRFLKSAWGKGFATESASAVLLHGFEDLALERIVARADKRNTASIHVIEKLNMRFLSESICDGFPAVLYEMTRTEWGKNGEKSA